MLLKSSTANLSKSDIVFKSNFAHLFFITIPSNFSYVYREYTITSRESMHLNPVYPCAYREHIYLDNIFYLKCGLSLCIQGTCNLGRFVCILRRFIPVHTGNIKYQSKQPRSRSVYPCAYREHKIFNFIIWLITGLSLCIQGTFIRSGIFTITPRFIPVHTGNI